MSDYSDTVVTLNLSVAEALLVAAAIGTRTTGDISYGLFVPLVDALEELLGAEIVEDVMWEARGPWLIGDDVLAIAGLSAPSISQAQRQRAARALEPASKTCAFGG